MASVPEGTTVDIHHGHKREQSQDSGAYIDWNSEDSASPTGTVDGNVMGDFVTVVAVESNAGNENGPDSPFVTVLEITDENGKGNDDSDDVTEEVLVYRLPGERLGFGLKFEGGTNTVENVKRLFIQSSAPDSPASRAECSWGTLVEGDEIIKIDGRDVRRMTRLDCVRCLKESSVVIKLYVRHTRGAGERRQQAERAPAPSSKSPLVISAEVKKKVPPPPPIPPRKIPRKSLSPPAKEEVLVVGPPKEFCDVQQAPVPKVRSIQTLPDDSSASKNQSKSSVFVPAKEVKQDVLDPAKKLSKRGVIDLKHIPPEPEVYLDLVAQEEVKNNWESESDDTGSTISTVIGFALSATTNSSLSDIRSSAGSYCDSTSPSTPTSTPSTPLMEVAKVLIPFQNTDNNDFLFTKMISDKVHDVSGYDEKASTCNDEIPPLQPPLSFQDAPLSYGNEEIKMILTDGSEREGEEQSPTMNLEESSDEVESSKMKSAGGGKMTSLIPRLAKSIGLLSPPRPSPRKESSQENGKSRFSKKRPPPPPPRSDQSQGQKSESEAKSGKAPVSYLKKKKVKSDSKALPPPPESKSDKWENPAEQDSVSAAEVSPVPSETGDIVGQSSSPENQDEKLCWPVPDLRNLPSRPDVAEAGNAWDATNNNAEDDGPSGSSENEAEASSNRDSFFSFQWGSSKHLETIGEDEEDVCNDDAAHGKRSKHSEASVGKIAFDVKIESADSTESVAGEDASSPQSPIVEEGSVVPDGDKAKEAAGEEDSREEAMPEDGPVKEDVEGHQDGTLVGEGDGNEAEEREEECGDPSSEDDKPRDVEPEKLKFSDGDLKEKENMVPVVTASVGLAPPPAFSRMPPDGHEFPQKYREEGLTMREDASILYGDDLKPELPPLPTSEPPTPQKYSFRVEGSLAILPSKNSLNGDLVRTSRANLWRQDERSEKSVRDKIAMFSSVTDPPVGPTPNAFSGKLSKYKSSDDVFYDDDNADCVGDLPNGKPFSRSIVSIDKIGGGPVRCYSKKSSYSESSVTPRSLDFANRTQSSMDLTSSSSSAYSSSCSPDSSLSSTTSSYLGYSSTLPRKSSRSEIIKNDVAAKTPGITRATSFSAHGRSQSLLDINPLPYKFRPRVDSSADDESRQSSLNLLIEQRRKNLSKLRGLVIPEKLTDPPPSQTIFDLPEIKSRDLLLTSKIPNAYKEETRNGPCKWETPTVRPSSPLNLSSPPWKDQVRSPNIPKYSPAFKRKSISVYGTAPTPAKKNDESERLKPPAKPPRSLPLHPCDNQLTRKSPDSHKDPVSKPYLSGEMTRTSDPARKPAVTSHGKSRNCSDAGRSEDDSDNDSAVSSSRSSMSHGFSPPSSPLLDSQLHVEEPTHRNHLFSSILAPEKPHLVRTLSSETSAPVASTLTTGSQGTCGVSGDCSSRRILKPQSVEAINRKNVLASAKYSRGFDTKSGSPLIQRKFASGEIPLEDDGAFKDPQMSFGGSRPIESYQFESSGVGRYSDAAPKATVTNYILPTDPTAMDLKSADIKIAFINEIEETDGESESNKKRLTKAESIPCSASVVSKTSASPRRTSVPCTNSQWDSPDEWSKANGKSSHPPLSEQSSESLRSRASSVDTILDNVRSRDIDRSSPGGRTKPSLPSNATATNRYVHDYLPTPEKSIDLYGRSLPGIGKIRSGSLKDAEEIGIISSRNQQRSVSVNDIRKAFEKVDFSGTGRSTKVLPNNLAHFGVNGNHVRVSSLDSTNSEDSCAFGPGQYGSSSNLHREQFGSITSLASSTSLISPQELQLLIDEANQTLEESGGSLNGSTTISHDVLVVILHRDSAGGSIGITLAGGADYESKEITVHKVLAGSPAERDGRIQKGDRILSINGKSMKGATHRESLAILKTPRPEVVLVVSRPKIDSICDSVNNDDTATCTSSRSNALSNRPPRILEGTLLSNSAGSLNEEIARGPPVTFTLVKDGAGLGFSLEGGKDSPVGDKPLVIKKIFTGGAAEKCGHLRAGDEILNVNGIDVTLMSRIEAWKLMKRIPDGNVSITVRRMVENSSSAQETEGLNHSH